jgi:hypothetical protein
MKTSVVEMAPCRRTVNIRWRTFHKQKKDYKYQVLGEQRDEFYNLPFPYTYFIIERDSARRTDSYLDSYYRKFDRAGYSPISLFVLFSNTSGNGQLPSKLYLPWLPNLDQYGRLCISSTSLTSQSKDKDIISYFWNSTFDLREGIVFSYGVQHAVKQLFQPDVVFYSDDLDRGWERKQTEDTIEKIYRTWSQSGEFFRDWGIEVPYLGLKND